VATQKVAQSVPRSFPDPRRLRGGRLDLIEESKIYFLAAAGLIKIGVTADVDKRVCSLRNSCPVELEFLGAYPGTRTDERELHERFRHLRRHGEWFAEAPELIAFIESAVSPIWHRSQEKSHA